MGNGRLKKIFIDKKYHYKGIAKHLYGLFEKECESSGISEIKVRASLYGLGFYKKWDLKRQLGKENIKE